MDERTVFMRGKSLMPESRMEMEESRREREVRREETEADSDALFAECAIADRLRSRSSARTKCFRACAWGLTRIASVGEALDALVGEVNMIRDSVTAAHVTWWGICASLLAPFGCG